MLTMAYISYANPFFPPSFFADNPRNCEWFVLNSKRGAILDHQSRSKVVRSKVVCNRLPSSFDE